MMPHSLIIAGSAVSAGNISATEQWVAGKTGISIFNDGPSITLNFDGQTYQVWEI